PSRISISALENHVVVENALKAEPKSTSCPAGSGIQCIATPLHAPVTEIVHRIAKHQVHRLGRASRMPQRQTKPDRSDFNDPLLRLNIEKACLTTCFPAFRWSNGIVDLILPRGLLTHDVRKLRFRLPRTLREVVPDSERGFASMRRLEQISRMPRRVERLQRHAATNKSGTGWHERRWQTSNFCPGQRSWILTLSIFRSLTSVLFQPRYALSGFDQTWLSRNANISNGPNPPLGHVPNLIVCHRRKIIAKKKVPYDGGRTGLCHLRRHFFEKPLALFGRVLNIEQFKSRVGQKRFHFVGPRDMTD